MAKRRMKLKVPIDDYPEPGQGDAGRRGLAWRKAVHKAAIDAAKDRKLNYLDKDAVEVEVVLYMDKSQLRFHDVDNLTKHLFDALQGQLGGASKKAPSRSGVLPNDAQIRRLTIEKRERRTQKQRSTLIVTGYVNS